MIAWVFIFLFILANAGLDAYLYKHKIWDDGAHYTRWIIRLLIVLSVDYYLGGFDLHFIIGSGLVFTALFDYVLNFMRGLDPDHLGDAYTDRIWKKIGPAWTALIKSAFLLIGLLII